MGYDEQPIQQRCIKYYKMGDGSLTPLGRPVCDVVIAAERDLKEDETLDGLGGFTCYGLLENSETCQTENLLPMGLSEGWRLKRDIPRDQVIT